MVRFTKLSFLCLPLLLSLPAFAGSEHSPRVETRIEIRHALQNAVQVQITPRGMKYFESNLNHLLGNVGVNLEEGYFAEMTYNFDRDLNPDDYASANPEAVGMYKQVRDLLSKWLVGFSLNAHRPTIEIGESGYVAQFSRFALVTDAALMAALNKHDGAVLAIELEVKKLTLSTNSILAWDSNNEILGQVGLQEASFIAGDSERPLKIRLPFYLRMNAQGGLDFAALEIENNLDTTSLELKYKKIVTPTFAVELNGKKYFLNKQELDRVFADRAPTILKKIREGLGGFMRQQLPALLNTKANQFLTGNLEQVQDMVPPGQSTGDQRPPFKWGLQLQNLNLHNSLNIDLTAFIEDAVNSQSAPIAAQAARGRPAFSVVPAQDFDIGLSIDRALINRVLQLSFERKNFESISQTDGSVLKLVAAPSIDYIQPPVGSTQKASETFVKLRVTIENKPGSMFLRDTIQVEFDIVAKLRPASAGKGMQLVLHSIDPDSLFLDDKYISIAGRLFKSKVRDGVKAELLKKSVGWSSGEEAIPGELPLPPEILGIKLDIHRVVMDPNGHLVMYLDYARKEAR